MKFADNQSRLKRVDIVIHLCEIPKMLFEVITISLIPGINTLSPSFIHKIFGRQQVLEIYFLFCHYLLGYGELVVITDMVRRYKTLGDE